jgi:hypothetical protein
LARPEVHNGVPIVHVGPYGANVSRTELVREDGRTRVADFALVPLA